MSNYLKENKELMKEWDWEKNKELDPNKLNIGSRKKAWWICNKGHSYESRIESRNRGTGCPYCAGQKVLKGFNDAESLFPKISKEWDYKNNIILPSEVTIGSGKIANFICENGHKYKMVIRDFCAGYNCPICSHRIIISGVNDLASYDKRIISEWDYKKNTDVNPKKISPYSTKKVWWIGQCGHEWKASIYSRTKMGTNCPICSEERHASVSEKSVLYYIRKSNKYREVFENYKDENIRLELDIYIPEIRTAIEYDGERWHKNSTKDLLKDKMCREQNILLIRIRENGCPKYKSNSHKIFLSNNKTKGIEKGIKKLLDYLSINNVDVNIERDNTEILTMINFMIKENSVLNLYPKISKEWHPYKNGNLKPEHTKPSSNKKVWWICPKGHEYIMDVYHRTKRSQGCPICAKRIVDKGINDLQTKHPELSKEWNYEKNGDLLPSDVSCGSSKKVWWKCSKGHEWESSISHRVNGRKCPYCSNKKVLKGYNDLATLKPHLVKEWNFKRNTNVSPYEVTVRSGKKVWWICNKCGFEWQATIDKRSGGTGCPNCARNKNLKR